VQEGPFRSLKFDKEMASSVQTSIRSGFYHLLGLILKGKHEYSTKGSEINKHLHAC